MATNLTERNGHGG